VADELAAGGFNLLLNRVTTDPADWITDLARGRRADGVIVIGQSLHHDSLNRLAASGFPMTVWGARLPGQQYVTVGSDNEAGGHAATAHLVSQGCRRIVFLGDPVAPEVGARLRGHLRALQEAGIQRMPQLEVPVRFGSDVAYHAIASPLYSDYLPRTLTSIALETAPWVRSISSWEKLNGAGVGSRDRAIFYTRDSMNLEGQIPLEPMQHPVEPVALEFIVEMEARVGGVSVYFPYSAAYLDGV
jgi:hypothetical protein